MDMGKFIERKAVSATVHPGIERLLTLRAKRLKSSVGYMLEVMAQHEFGPNIPADFRAGERVSAAWETEWPLPERTEDDE